MKVKYEQEWELSRTFPTRTVGQLIRLFYKYHTYMDRKVRKALPPISFLVNPIPFVLPDDPFAQDMYVAIYHGLRFAPGARYFVTIEQNIHFPMDGPHPCKLYLQVYPGGTYQMGRTVWLASMQIEGNFFNEDKIRVALKRGIRMKEYFCSDESQEEVIEFDNPTQIAYKL